MGVSIVKGGWGMPHCCGCKCCYIPCSSCCTGCDCGYVALAPAKAKASAVLAALFMMAARQVEADGSFQILLALSMFLTMMTAVLVAFSLRRTIPAGAGSLKEPLVHDGKDEVPDVEQGT